MPTLGLVENIPGDSRMSQCIDYLEPMTDGSYGQKRYGPIFKNLFNVVPSFYEINISN